MYGLLLFKVNKMQSVYCLYIYIYTYTYICSLCFLKSASKMGPVLFAWLQDQKTATWHSKIWTSGNRYQIHLKKYFTNLDFPEFFGAVVPQPHLPSWGKSVHFHVASSTATTSRPLQVPGSPKQIWGKKNTAGFLGTNKKKG